MNKYIQCKCSELGPLDISLKGLQSRIDASHKYDGFFSVLATKEFPRQIALRQCRICKKFYQESLCGHGLNNFHYLYEVPETDKMNWQNNPFPDPFAQIIESNEDRNAGL
jgi:hypothetical protein